MKPFLYVCLPAVLFSLCTSFKSPIAGKDDFYIVIEKSKYELSVYDANNVWMITYPVVFGNGDLGDKMMAGDRKTPEGTFHITNKRIHEKWNRFIAIDYPTRESIEKFNARKAKGLIPQDAKIGGDIGIHGTWPHEEYAIDQFQNWTMGCVSTKNEYIQQIFSQIPVGTKVIIKK